MNSFGYLIQGTAEEIDSCLFELFNFSSDIFERQVFVLTYDRKYSGTFSQQRIHSFFYPNSTWSQGRNFLLEAARQFEFEYYIFMDGDVRLESGTLEAFELLLDEHKPILGLPLTDSIRNSGRFNPEKKVQNQHSFDQLVQAYHVKAVTDQICLPFLTKFDSISLWYSCEINQYVTFKTYQNKILQFNEIIFINMHHTVDSGLQKGSTYKGGMNKEGRAVCKREVLNLFGFQPFSYGTLFHPWFIPRPRYIDLSWQPQAKGIGNHKVLLNLRFLLFSITNRVGLFIYILLSKVFRKFFLRI